MEGPKFQLRTSLFPLPPNPVAGILEDHADRLERVADSVRGSEVFPLSSVLPQRHNQVEEAVHEVRAFRSRLEDAQHLAERPKRLGGVVEGVASRTRFDGL